MFFGGKKWVLENIRICHLACSVNVAQETSNWRLRVEYLHSSLTVFIITHLMLTPNLEHWKGLTQLSDVSPGSEPGFYQWSRGVCLQANLDLLLDWAQSNGLGEVAVEHMHTLSSAVTLLATPRKNLLQVRQKFLHPDAHLIWTSGVTALAVDGEWTKTNDAVFPCA